VELLKSITGYAVIFTATDGETGPVATVAQSLARNSLILDLVLPRLERFELLAEWRSHPARPIFTVFDTTSKDLKQREEEKRVHPGPMAESLFRKQDSWRNH